MPKRSGGAFFVTVAAIAVLASSLGARDSLAEVNCEDSGCGLNGAWLGDKVRFRTLNLDGTANPQGLKILSFSKKDEKQKEQKLELRVYGDEVIGIDPATKQTLRGTDIKSTVLVLGHDESRPEYSLTFTGADQVSFWADCKGEPSICARSPKLAWVYSFEATTLPAKRRFELCKPGLSDDNKDLQGKLVIFGGDLYDEGTYKVSLPKATDKDYRTVNFACAGTAISKMHLLRHTSVSLSGNQDHVPLRQRQALLRLLTADYCGIGRSFTNDGVPIGISLGQSNVALTTYKASSNLEAHWTEAGALCVTKPRLQEKVSLELINKTCNKQLKPCGLARQKASPYLTSTLKP